MCADMTIHTENNLVYELTHSDDGLHIMCHPENSPGLLIDQHVDGFTFPVIGHVMHFIGTRLTTPIVESITKP